MSDQSTVNETAEPAATGPARKLDESDLTELPIGAGDLVVDCGASVGDVTAVLVEKGAEVHAFEPNPVAFAHLSERFASAGNVTCYQKAVSVAEGTAIFYPHENLVENPDAIDTANGSSLLDFKGNVSTEHGYEVGTIDLVAFLEGLDRPVRLLKIDIEGAEIDVVNRLLDEDALRQVEQVLVETHERKIPELKEPTDALRQRIIDKGLDDKVSLDWH